MDGVRPHRPHARSSTAIDTPRRAAAAAKELPISTAGLSRSNREIGPQSVVNDRAHRLATDAGCGSPERWTGRIPALVLGSRLTVVGDDRRGACVKVAEVEAAAAHALGHDLGGCAADAPCEQRRPRGQAPRSRIGDRAVARFPCRREFHRVARHLVGDRPPLDFVRVEQSRTGPALDDAASIQARFMASAMPAFIPYAAKGTQICAASPQRKTRRSPEPVGEHPAATQSSEHSTSRRRTRRGRHRRDVADAAFAVRRHRRAEAQRVWTIHRWRPSTAKTRAAIAWIDAVDRPGRSRHHCQRLGSPDDEV